MNNLQNLEFVKRLTQLTSLNLKFNNLNFMEPLRDLRLLECLNLYQNELFNVEELQIFENMPNLTDLDLSLNRFSKEITSLQLKWVLCKTPTRLVINKNIEIEQLEQMERPDVSPFANALLS